jgi:hypothetical protein
VENRAKTSVRHTVKSAYLTHLELDIAGLSIEKHTKNTSPGIHFPIDFSTKYP